MADLPLSSEAFIQDANENIISAQGLIRDLVNAEQPTAFHFVLGRILENLVEQIKRLALEESRITDIAWAYRNLMELLVWSRYIEQSDTTFQRFKDDFFVDGTLMMDAIIKVYTDVSQKFPGAMRISEEHYRLKATLQQAREGAHLGTQDPLKASQIAKKVGLEKDFAGVNSITSKLVHPTALSILKTFNLDVMKPIFISHGLLLAADVVSETRTHIGRFGVKPAR